MIEVEKTLPRIERWEGTEATTRLEKGFPTRRKMSEWNDIMYEITNLLIPEFDSASAPLLTESQPNNYHCPASHSLGYDTGSIQTANYDSDFLPDFRFPPRSKSKKGKSNPREVARPIKDAIAVLPPTDADSLAASSPITRTGPGEIFQAALLPSTRLLYRLEFIQKEYRNWFNKKGRELQ
uniref:Uncharacterized protein n=1 Tax=Populus alba TaxID=43335 RepID=A0A4U5PKG2_POPAL|nr:hypothetical protein D5086_0000216540 [Populus alba]